MTAQPMQVTISSVSFPVSVALYSMKSVVRFENGDFCVGDNRDNAFVTRRMENNKQERDAGASNRIIRR